MLFRLALFMHAISKPANLEPSSAKLNKLTRIVFDSYRSQEVILDDILK